MPARDFIPKLVCLAFSALLTGCLETTEEFILNPDGSGKVKHTVLFQPLNFAEKNVDPVKQMKDVVAKELSNAKGVDAWTDVGYERAADGRIRFWGTAYFRDLHALRFHNGGFQSESLAPQFTRTGTEVILELKTKKQESTPAPPPTAPLEERAVAEKVKYAQMRPMIAGMLGTWKEEKTFLLPGKVVETGGFQTTPAGALKAAWHGAKMVEALDEVVADDARWRELVAAGWSIEDPDPKLDDDFRAKVYGTTKPFRAVATGAQRPQFDYAAEAAEAARKYPAMVGALKLPGAAAAPVAPIAGTTAFKSLRVGGVRLIHFSDKDNNIRPLNQHAEYTLSLVGEFGGAVHEAVGGRVTRAVADTGESLLPEREWDRKIQFPRLSKDKTTVVFDLKLNVPGETARGLKELAGELEYIVAGEPRRVDLGFTELKAGSAGQKYEAVIKSVEPDKWNTGHEKLEVTVQLPRHAIKSVSFLDETGAKLEVKEAGSMMSETSSTLGYSLPGKFPARGRIELEVFEGSQKFAVPFTLTDISLLGQRAHR